MSDIQNTCCVKQPECVGFPPDHHRHRIIVKNLFKKKGGEGERQSSNFWDKRSIWIHQSSSKNVLVMGEKKRDERHWSYRWHIFRGKLVGCVGDQQAGLPHCTVPYHYTLYSLHLQGEIQENVKQHWKKLHVFREPGSVVILICYRFVMTFSCCL